NAAEERGATAEVILHTHYRCYKIPDEAPVVAHAVSALSALGMPASIDSSMGGSDANMFNANGIQSVCLGMGFRQVHSCREEMPIDELANAICLVYGLVTVKE
ncbi:MAG TPA: M20/M25/M40 family metallo-hydrolase, partial [Bacillota bacterium]|nr:M20/M25/M40 family metallo-hydrolase [Bacillota bacterium]